MNSDHTGQLDVPRDAGHFGAGLREARLLTGRTLDDVACRTKIPLAMLERIEQGDLAALPAEVFVIGFLRSYARELRVSAEEAVARYRLRTQSREGAPQVHEIDRRVASDRAAIERAPAERASVERDATPSSLVVQAEAVESDADGAAPAPMAKLLAPVDELIGRLTKRIPAVESALGRGPTFALVVLLVVLVATITLSLLLGGDPRPGRGLS